MINIIGSGIIGLTIGFQLQKKGFEVEIFSDRLSGESSLAAVGMLAPFLEIKPSEHDLLNLMIESNNLWPGFSDKINSSCKIDIEFQQNSSLAIANTNDEMEHLKFKQKLFKNFKLPFSVLDRKQTLDQEPNLHHDILGSIKIQNQNQVNPLALKKALLDSFINNGGKINQKSKIKKIELKGSRVIIFDGIKNYECSKLVLASGSWSRKLIKDSFNTSLPVRPLKGVTVEFENVDKKRLFSHNLWFKEIYLAPRKNGNIVIGATEEEDGFNNKILLRDIFFLTKNLWECLPCSHEYEFKTFRSGLRPATFDGFPIIGFLNNLDNIICAFGHYRNGILLAPITAQIILDLLNNKKKVKKYDFFSPNRFK